MWDIVITIFCIVMLVMAWVMLYDSNRFVVTTHTIRDKRIKKSARAVVLADLHNKCYGQKNQRLLDAIAECKPDFILVAGDIPTAKPGESLEVAVNLMKELTTCYPVFYGSGNHEHRMKLYPEVYGDMGDCYEKALKDAGVVRLVNSHINLQDFGIAVYGLEIDRRFYKRFKNIEMEEKYLTQILGPADEEGYTILIAHNPDYFSNYAAWGADLVCSGHVHGGMVRIPFWGKGIVSPSVRLFPKYDGGIFAEEKSTMLLSRGLGMHTIPVRAFNPGEMLLVEFFSEDEAK